MHVHATTDPPHSSAHPLPRAQALGCVSFLNSKPLIDALVHGPLGAAAAVHFAVPSQLLPLIESGTVATALMSVVDYQLAREDLLLIPAGMIGCDGHTFTVRIFSRVPPNQITALHGDTDSHTSVLLGQLILRERYGVAVPMVPLHAREGIHLGGATGGATRAEPEAILLIGDKVVNACPSAETYPYQLDLGDEWKQLTGLPFVFAMWMMRRDVALRDPAAAREVATLLARARELGTQRTGHLLDRYAGEKGWPRDLARQYFTEYLRYEVTPRAREGLALFFEKAARLGLLPIRREVRYLE
jgi:chorismate dehydratase